MSLALLVAVSAMAAGEPLFQLTDGNSGMLYGGPAMAKASRDTTWLLGGPNAYTGRFQDAAGNANWQGWTHLDVTYNGVLRWNVDTFHVPTGGGNYAMWCGQRAYPTECTDGYGNSWNEGLVFTYAVANPAVNTTVRLQCLAWWDTEPACDYFKVQQNRGGTWARIEDHDGLQLTTVAIDQTVTFTPSDYVGAAGDELQLRFLGMSDSGWSDEDCLWDTVGLVQVDNIRVTIGAEVFYDDHEDGNNYNWTPLLTPAVGDYSKLWTGLQDVDPCVQDASPMVAFIDDGVVVPGTDGTPCITWCYGPGGYIVNNTGGLTDDLSMHNDNTITSPVLTWPAGNDGAILAFDVYRHEDSIMGPSPGIYYAWDVRSTNSGDPSDLPTRQWKNRNFVHNGRSYISQNELVTDLMMPGRTHVQVRLEMIEYGWVWGYNGVDGTPAPYFDNVVFKVFPFAAPSMSARDIDLAQDNFPQRGTIDLANLANDFIRFDMARKINAQAVVIQDPGDSIFVDIGLPRAGSVLNNMPKLVVKMRANPLFDGVRVVPPNFVRTGDILDGWVYGDSTRAANGTLVANRYNFDLPDSTFFFPGDVIHYYIEAKDNVAGDIGTSTMPGDISRIGEFDGVFPYGGNSTFIVRGLPTLFDLAGNQPEILYWNDFANRGGENEWNYALNSLGYNEHVDYDIYYTNGPSSGVGNGLGGRATALTMGGYNTLLYTCGDLGVYTISNGDQNVDPSNDIGVLTDWFEDGGKHAFMTGDDLVNSLNSTVDGLLFLNTYLGATLSNNDIRPLIGNQMAPVVQPVAGNGIFTTPEEWIAFGGCIGINDFDAITTRGSSVRLARFLNPGGTPDYTYSAALRFNDVADVITLPYDFQYIFNSPDYVPSLPGYSVRSEILRDVLIAFGHIPGGIPIDVPNSDVVFGVSNYPNPFNPATEIKMTLPKAGHVSLKVFNVRGELVRTLVNGELAAGPQSIEWNGTTDSGRQVASGVYFYETKYNGETMINKMALVK
jgi:hypothetical protein